MVGTCSRENGETEGGGKLRIVDWMSGILMSITPRRDFVVNGALPCFHYLESCACWKGPKEKESFILVLSSVCIEMIPAGASCIKTRWKKIKMSFLINMRRKTETNWNERMRREELGLEPKPRTRSYSSERCRCLKVYYQPSITIRFECKVRNIPNAWRVDLVWALSQQVNNYFLVTNNYKLGFRNWIS